MTKVLITGATGNVGTEVIEALQKIEHSLAIFAGVRNLENDTAKFENSFLQYIHFDFTNPSTYKLALEGIQILYLLRPPQISEVEKYFKPIIEICKEVGAQHIVFLSVQGVEKSKIIPHHKIEKLIVESHISYTFLRPAYFMQNFTTTLHNDLVKNKRVFLPAGKAKFTLIDVRDIGTVSACILTKISEHVNQSYELTSTDKLTFLEMTEILSKKLKVKINYTSPNLVQFFLTKRKEKMPIMLIFVMIMLHYLPRFQKEPELTNCVKEITNQNPISFQQFIDDFKTDLIS